MNKYALAIDFFLSGKLYAARYSILVPQIGDEVRFNNVVYKVVHRIWMYDEKLPRVALSIEPVEQE